MLFWKNAKNYPVNRISIYVLNVYVPNAELFLEEYMFCIILQSVKMSLSIYNNGKSYHNVEKVVKPIFGYMFELHKVGCKHKPWCTKMTANEWSCELRYNPSAYKLNRLADVDYDL